ncbi:MAG: hypothetical protein F6K63_29635 [Moorea sp. SIO1G6]|uniref:hypothetical protein n=1 Tax=Moorena sp. SIO1G6 TaxID=2607840 RepID=UPI0013C1F4D0|nr:hypothetical protein [Moorena sp. SIO1G6]NET68331.1 hypothetical protein [Moorena sp. SIO1G6]
MPWQFPQRLTQSLGAIIILLGCILAVGKLQQPQLNALKQSSKNISPADLQRDVEAKQVYLNLLQRLPTFGFDNILADWVFMNFLQYFGDQEARQITSYQLSPEYFDVIINRDPKFLTAYFFLSSSSSLYAGMPEKSVALMEKGLQSLSPKVPPKSYYVWRYKGIDELLFLGDAKAAQESFEKSADWASKSADEESQNIAEISRNTAEFIKRNPTSKIAQVSAWSMVLNNSPDPRTSQIAISRIEALGGKVIITPEGAVTIKMPQTD